MLKKFKFDDSALRNLWHEFYDDNDVFNQNSAYEYNELVLKYSRWRIPSLKKLMHDNVFWVYYDECDTPRVIIPLNVRNYDKKIYILGDNIAALSSLDLIYPKDVRKDDFKYALLELVEKYKGYTFIFSKIHEKSLFCQFMNDELEMPFNVSKRVERECVKIEYPSDEYEDYYQSLSKSARQNLRTTYNRMKKDTIDYELGVLKASETIPFLKDIGKIYVQREHEREKTKDSFFKDFQKTFIFTNYSVLAWAIKRLSNQITFLLRLNNEIAAFMIGFKLSDGDIIFPILAIDSKFSKYSPGKLMINEAIKYALTNCKETKVLDLARGTEKYKLDMGGRIYLSYEFVLTEI